MKDHSPILKRNLTGCVAAVLLILLDQFTKMLAVAHLKDQPSNVLIDGVFELRYLENRGSAFGMMQNKLIILIPVTVVVTLLILYLFFKKLPAYSIPQEMGLREDLRRPAGYAKLKVTKFRPAGTFFRRERPTKVGSYADRKRGAGGAADAGPHGRGHRRGLPSHLPGGGGGLHLHGAHLLQGPLLPR